MSSTSGGWPGSILPCAVADATGSRASRRLGADAPYILATAIRLHRPMHNFAVPNLLAADRAALGLDEGCHPRVLAREVRDRVVLPELDLREHNLHRLELRQRQRARRRLRSASTAAGLIEPSALAMGASLGSWGGPGVSPDSMLRIVVLRRGLACCGILGSPAASASVRAGPPKRPGASPSKTAPGTNRTAPQCFQGGVTHRRNAGSRPAAPKLVARW